MTDNDLIAKLEALGPGFRVVGDPLVSLCDVLSIVRAHESTHAAHVPEDVRRRVAAALCGWRDGKRSHVPFDELSAAEQAAYLSQADDAILAITSQNLPAQENSGQNGPVEEELLPSGKVSEDAVERLRSIIKPMLRHFAAQWKQAPVNWKAEDYGSILGGNVEAMVRAPILTLTPQPMSAEEREEGLRILWDAFERAYAYDDANPKKNMRNALTALEAAGWRKVG